MTATTQPHNRLINDLRARTLNLVNDLRARTLDVWNDPTRRRNALAATAIVPLSLCIHLMLTALGV